MCTLFPVILMNCGQRNDKADLGFKAAKIWFSRGIMKTIRIERNTLNVMNVARYKKIVSLVQDLHFLKIYTRNVRSFLYYRRQGQRQTNTMLKYLLYNKE